jgi:hypothetical protein
MNSWVHYINLYRYKIDNAFRDKNKKESLKKISHELFELYNSTYNLEFKIRLYLLILEIEKELCSLTTVESDKYKIMTSTLQHFDELEKQIDKSSDLFDEIEYERIKRSFIRQRAIIWEHMGDFHSNYLDKKKYYTNWKNDSLKAIELSDQIQTVDDKEVLACAYFNLASAINRLQFLENESIKANNILKAMSYIDKSIELLENINSVRYLGVSYLHKSDCIERLLYCTNNDKNKFLNYCTILKENAIKAIEYLELTTDYLFIGWAYRLYSKSLFYLNEKYEDELEFVLHFMDRALEYMMNSEYILGIAECLRDYDEYFQLCQKELDESEQQVVLKRLFLKETEAFRYLLISDKINKSKMIELQDQFGEIFKSLVKYLS